MQIKTCPNGHRYDADIYGDECPICAQSPRQYSNAGPTPAQAPAYNAADGHSRIITPQAAPAAYDSDTGMYAPEDDGNPRTVICYPEDRPDKPDTAGRKLVGFLVTYTGDPNGKAFNIYEGRNLIGRDRKCDICVPGDNKMSGTHLSILYREVDKKFKFRDEQSSNGTYLNDTITDEGQLSDRDIIRAGNTTFIFVEIPQI